MTDKKYCLIPAAFVPFFAAVFYFDILDGTRAAQVLYLLAKVFILIYPLFFMSKTDGFKQAFKMDFKGLSAGIAVGGVIFAAGYALFKIPAVFDVIAAAAPFVKRKAAGMGVADHYLTMAFVISFVHSMLEEYYWRWFLFGASKALFLSAGAFSLHHFVVLDFYYDWPAALALTFLVFAGGVIFNLLYRCRKNVWGAWAAHAGADLLIFYVGYVLLYKGA